MKEDHPHRKEAEATAAQAGLRVRVIPNLRAVSTSY